MRQELDIKNGDIITVPSGTRYYIAESELITPFECTFVVKEVTEFYIYVEGDQITAIDVDSLINKIESVEYNIGDPIHIPKGTLFMNSNFSLEKTPYDINSRIMDLSALYIMVYNFTGRILKFKLSERLILKKWQGLNEDTSNMKTIVETYGQWLSILKSGVNYGYKTNNNSIRIDENKLYGLNQLYKNTLTIDEIDDIQKYSENWIKYFEYCFNRDR